MGVCGFYHKKIPSGEVIEFCSYFNKRLENSECIDCPYKQIDIHNVSKKYSAITITVGDCGDYISVEEFDTLPQALTYKRIAEMQGHKVIILDSYHAEVYFR